MSPGSLRLHRYLSPASWGCADCLPRGGREATHISAWAHIHACLSQCSPLRRLTVVSDLAFHISVCRPHVATAAAMAAAATSTMGSGSYHTYTSPHMSRRLQSGVGERGPGSWVFGRCSACEMGTPLRDGGAAAATRAACWRRATRLSHLPSFEPAARLLITSTSLPSPSALGRPLQLAGRPESPA